MAPKRRQKSKAGDEGSSQRFLAFQNSSVVPEGVFPDNKIKTSKYTYFNFVFKNLWEQFHKFGNCYFFVISIVMFLGEKTSLFVGTIKAFSTLGTLVMMMSLTALMAWLDDRRRAKADDETNETETLRVPKDQLGYEADLTEWQEVEVGDIVIVRKDEEVCADMVPIFSSAVDAGAIYVSTANLDGETNLKLKAASPVAQRLLSGGQEGPFSDKGQTDVLKNLPRLSGSITAETPSKSIHTFTGQLELLEASGETTSEALNAEQLVLRGTTLRNTDWMLGVVVYTGKESRMVLNSQEAPIKYSNLEKIINKVMLLILAAQAFLALISNVQFNHVKEIYRAYWYLQTPDLILPDWFAYWLTFFVLYSNLMPISLYPTLEATNAAQAYFIKNDEKMYSGLHAGELEFAAGVRSSNLCQELGQVGYIFSDKTGTLTQNVMELKKMFVNGKMYGSVNVTGDRTKGFNGGQDVLQAMQGPDQQALNDFLEVLAVSNTVMVGSPNPDGSPGFEAESPDEIALVEAVARCGWTMQSRDKRSVFIDRQGPGAPPSAAYEVLATNAFNSTRKRMSVVVRSKGGGQALLLVKGADNVMLERAAADPSRQALLDTLGDLSREGLRTLVLGRKTLAEPELQKFLADHKRASEQISNRDQALANVAEQIETNFTIAGATAIEDKLQDGVPEAIESIRAAGIKLWVLTGDKLETAKEIGFSARVLTHEMFIVEMDGDVTAQQAYSQILRECEGRDSRECAIMITGPALEHVLEDADEKEAFVEASQLCVVVIGCRVSPAQKAQMVQLVRDEVVPCPVTLAVGDGANDVPMIQTAQVGIGICGREGRQAVNNSDFSIGQFRFLERLLLVHGRWNYRRACKFTLFTFWRNAVQVLMICYYTFVSGFSGTSLFEDWIRLSFNFLCSFPIIATGIFDKDVDDVTALKHPELYRIGREGIELTNLRMATTLLSSLVHAGILLAVTFFAFPAMDLYNAGDYYTFGTACYTCLIIDMAYRVFWLNYTHNKWTVGSIVLSIFLYVVYLFMYAQNPIATVLLTPNMYNVPRYMAGHLAFWLCCLICPAITLCFDMWIDLLWQKWDPYTVQINKLRDRMPSTSDEVSKEDSRSKGRVGASNETARLLPEDENAADIEDIEHSDFAQQRVPDIFALPADRGLFIIIIGVCIVALGGIALSASTEARQFRINYEGPDGSDPLGTQADEVHLVDVASCPPAPEPGQPGGSPCLIDVTIPREIPAPVYMYYVISPFYQNFNDYIKSEASKELTTGYGADDPNFYIVEAQRELLCTPAVSVNDQGEDIVPCGMKATSVFSDTFEVFNGGSPLVIDESNIAWPSDVARYLNPADYGTRAMTQWLYDLYPQLFPAPAATPDPTVGGVKDQKFANWMRPAALNRVWNPAGILQDATGTQVSLAAGQEVTVRINNTYPTAGMDVSKQLVFTTVGRLGARHHGFAYMLFTLGTIAILAGALVVPCQRLIRSEEESDDEGSEWSLSE